MAIPNSNVPMTREGLPQMDENSLLAEIKNSILAMQNKMKEAYDHLGGLKISGKSKCGKIEIIMTATYEFEDIKISPHAFADETTGKFSPKQFEVRLREAWKNLSDSIRTTTQNKTMELLQNMDIPPDIRKLSEEGDV